MAELLRLLISTYKEMFKSAQLTDTLLFQHYATTVLVVDEVCTGVRRGVGVGGRARQMGGGACKADEWGGEGANGGCWQRRTRCP